MTGAILVLFWAAWVAAIFYVGHKVGKPRGRQWFWWCFFLGWIGVLVMRLRAPVPGSPAAIGSGMTEAEFLASQETRLTAEQWAARALEPAEQS